MFKRIGAILLAALCLLSVGGANKTPIFKDYATEFEVYIGEATSAAQIVSVTESDFRFVSSVCGESFKAEKEDFNLEKFLSEFSARIIFTEEIAEGVSYYAYSPKIKYRQTVKGQTVNLQVFIGKQVTVGAPIICGSF